MQRLSAPSNKQSSAAQQQQPAAFEKTIHFAQAQAIVWQIKFILNQIISKKMMSSAANELENLSQQFGKEFDKYLLKELIEQIDLKDPVRAQKDKNEPFKVQLLNQELARCSQKPEFLLYFSEIAQQNFNERIGEFLNELTKRLRLNFPNQLLVALSIFESSKEESQSEAIKILKQKLVDYHSYGKPEPLPDYAVHRLMYLLSTNFELNQDENLREIAQYIRDSNPLKNQSHVSLRSALQTDLMFANTNHDDPSISLLRDGNGLDNLDKTYKILEPWQLLLDLGHYCTYNNNYLLKVLEDFKDINEKTMARTLLHLSHNHTGTDDQYSRIAYNSFEACKKGDSSNLNKEPGDKKTQMTWSIDNLARAFREMYSTLNWSKVFDSLADIEEYVHLDGKAFQIFLQIFNKSKPQNLAYPLSTILNQDWENSQLQLNFIENSISVYIEKKEKTIPFSKTERRQELIEEITGIKDKVPIESLHVWFSVDLVERLILLSDSHNFTRVRQLFDYPIKHLPDYLLLTLSQCKPSKGNLMIDELLSLLLPQFLGNHINSIPVLQNLWKNNSALMIRGICELCRHDQRIMNLSRVLDITQEVKESLIPIVNCDDYYFAVNLGILAGKRDFLHYDVWLASRITEVGTPFIKALIKYLKEHIIQPIHELIKRHTINGQLDLTADALENQKSQVLERSHLSKEKLCITIEHLSNLQNRQNQLIREETFSQIREIVVKISEHFPNQVQQLQNSEEIDNAANDYFQKVFSAESHLVDQKIVELIDTMQRFKESDAKKEQEIYACMLHSLFDEYRFLHRYPQEYLEKIAKLFGAIIKHKIIDGTLQDIALKFVFEAFRREGKRQKFGIITIKQFFDMLPQFPSFFEEIYDIRQNIAQINPQMIRDIEELYDKTMKNRKQPEDGKKGLDDDKMGKDEYGKGKHGQGKQADSLSSMPKINENDFLANFQQNVRGQLNQNIQQSNQKKQQQQQQQTLTTGQTQQDPLQRTSTPLQSQDFIPSYKAKQQQQPVTIDSNTPSASKPAEVSQLNVQSAVFRRPNQGAQPTPPLGATQSAPLSTAQTTLVQQQTTTVIPNPTATTNVNPANTTNASMNIMNAANAAFRPMTIRSPAPQTLMSQTNPNFPPPQSQFAPHQQQQMPPPQHQQLQHHSHHQPPSQQTLQLQAQLEAKLQKALQENAKIRLEDLIEDSNLPGPAAESQEQIKFICNNTGKNNFAQKLEELKQQVNVSNSNTGAASTNTTAAAYTTSTSANATSAGASSTTTTATTNSNPLLTNLNWFIHYILTKRISQQTTNLHHLYIEMIRQLNPKESITVTLAQIVEIFKKCMLVDEEQFLRISQRPANAGSPIKQYLINLGQFLGGLTVASNRPIYARELDIKKLLVEGFLSNKLKYVVTFVCRVFKECQKSSIFKYQNPWIKANLEILREIYDWALQNNQDGMQNEVIMEIDSMCKSLNLNSISEIKDSGFLKASVTRQFQSQSQQVEVSHLMNKTSLIPPPPPPPMQQQRQGGVPQRNQSVSPVPTGVFNQPGGMFPQYGSNAGLSRGLPQLNQQQQPSSINTSELLSLQQQTSQDIYHRVVVSQDFMQHFTWLGNNISDLEAKLRAVVGKAVDSSIVEILPPVVDRSVTIALITTRELVLKDFAFDGNYEKILTAADLIVQNLAGSLALVTCREPLKMSLTTNLKKAIQQLIAEYSQTLANAGLDVDEMMNENSIHEISSIASRENLELGCKLIKKSVIQKALAKVREDQQIIQAINRRKNSQQSPQQLYQDEGVALQIAELPPQLKPNPNGLTEAQFQVYEDFARLNTVPKKSGEASGVSSTADSRSISAVIHPESSNISDIETILKQLDRQQGLDDVLKFQLSQKLQLMSQDLDPEETQKLWIFCQKWLHALCEKTISSSDQEAVSGILEYLSFIVQKYRGEDLQKRFTKYFLESNESFPNNINLTVLLMKNSIISVVEWDSQISQQLREYLQFQQQDRFLQFVIAFIEQTIIQEKIFTYTQFPNVISMIEKISEQPAIGKIFSNILDDLKQKFAWNKDTLKNYFHEWAVMSFEENNPKQEQEVNKFFYNLQQMGLYKDSDIMYNFCKVMVEVSIERALYTASGQKRPFDRLDYRYIESFLKLMVVLLKTSDINKHEFMSKLFEAIQEVLDEDHISKRAEFNQKPYYRLLINILTAVNNSQFFNPKTHLLILFSLADLFSKLNPNKYPAFSFAWLELISHKQFMPHFLAFSQNSQQLQNYNAFVGNLYQSIGPQSQQQKKGGTTPGGSATGAQNQVQTSQQQLADNTFYQKWFKFKELIVNLFTFLKNNMIPGQKLSVPLVKYYEATLRVVLVIRHDFPEFLCDFYFNFVNSLPEHCIQLRNIILSANPRNIPYHNPFSKNLKVDTIKEIYLKPRMLSMSYDSQIQSMYENQDATFNDHQVYLALMNLREDLEKYFRNKSPQLIQVICDKMMSSEEIINGRRKINSNIINAVALFIGNYTLQKKTPQFQQKECYDMLKKIILTLNNETRWCFLNCLVNELRYINSYTYFYSWIVLYLFSDIDETIQEQITRILIERLQVHEPYPWGLCITFRELLQNPKYQFVKKSFVVSNMTVFEQLFQTRLQPFLPTWQTQKQALQQQEQQMQQQHQQQQQMSNE